MRGTTNNFIDVCKSVSTHGTYEFFGKKCRNISTIYVTYWYVRTLYLYGEILFICIFCFFLSLVPISCDIQTDTHTNVTLLLLYVGFIAYYPILRTYVRR